MKNKRKPKEVQEREWKDSRMAKFLMVFIFGTIILVNLTGGSPFFLMEMLIAGAGSHFCSIGLDRMYGVISVHDLKRVDWRDYAVWRETTSEVWHLFTTEGRFTHKSPSLLIVDREGVIVYHQIKSRKGYGKWKNLES